MNTGSIKMNFSELGDIEYKTASTRKELEQAYALVYKEYLLRGFILPKYYKSGLRITLHHALPGTITFVALKDKEVIATLTTIPDSPLLLPMDTGYQEEADRLRGCGRKICETGYLSMKTGLFGRGMFSMFNFKKLEFMMNLFKLAFQYSYSHAKFDNMCIVTNPRYMIFNFLPFETIGKVKYYGYDRVAIKKKAAVAKHLDFHKIEGMRAKKIALRKIFLENKIPTEIFENKYRFTPEDLRYFFVEKSNVFEGANKKQKEWLRSAYGLNEGEIEHL